MELDLRLQRDGGHPWGFRLIGGKELDLPLTVIEATGIRMKAWKESLEDGGLKLNVAMTEHLACTSTDPTPVRIGDDTVKRTEQVLPNSSAERAGLQNGDAVSKIGTKSTMNLGLREALLLIDEAHDYLCMGVVRGLYDPVIDDQDPVFEEPADFDRRSEPTEVPFKIQNFDDPTQGFGPHYIYDEDGRLMEPNFIQNPGLFDNGQAQYLYAIPNGDVSRGMSLEPEIDFSGRGSLGFRESRSLTASPFSVSSKPYRPFSTEPLKEIPPVEDPIILNPNYKDDFGYKFENGGVEGVLNLPQLEPNFKLPKSEKYDPNWEENNRILEEKLEKSIKINRIMNEKLRKSAERVIQEINSFSSEIVLEEKKEIIETEVKCESKKINISSWELSEQFKREVLDAKKKLKEEEMKRKTEMEENMQKESSKIFEMRHLEEEKMIISKTRQEFNQIEKEGVNQIEKTAEKRIDSIEELNEMMQKELHQEDIHIENMTKSDIQQKVSVEHKKQVKKEDFTYSQDDKEYTQVIKQEKDEEKEISKNIIPEKIDEVTKVKTKQEFKTTHAEAENIKIEVKPEQKVVQSIEDVNDKSKVVKTALKTNEKNNVSKEEYEESSQFEYNEIERDEEIENHWNSDNYNEDKVNGDNLNNQSQSVNDDYPNNRRDERRKDSEQRVYSIGLQTIPNIRGVVHSQHYDLLLKTFFIHLTDVMVALSRFMLTQPALSETERNEKRYERERHIVKEREQRKGSYVDQKSHRREEYSYNQIKKEISEDLQQRREQENYIENELSKLEVQRQKLIENKKTGAKMSQKSEEVTRKMNEVISEFQNKTEEVRKRSSSRSSIEEEVALEGDPLEWLDKVNSRRSSKDFVNVNKRQYESKQESRQIKTYKPKPGWQTYRAIVEAHVYTNPEVIFEDHTAEMLETASYERVESTNLATESNQAIVTEKIAVQNAVNQEIGLAKETREIIKPVVATATKQEMLIHTAAEKTEVNEMSKHEAIDLKQIKSEKAEVVRDHFRAVEVSEIDAVKEEISELQLTKDKNVEAKKSLEIVDIRALEITEVVVENEKLEELKISKQHEAKAEKSVNEITALEISEVDITADEVAELNIEKHKEIIAKKGFEEAKSLSTTETLAEKDEIKVLSVVQAKEAVANTAIVEENAALQIAEVKVEMDDVKEIQIHKKVSETARQAYVETSALQVTEIHAEVDKQKIQELEIAEIKKFNAEQSVEVSKALEIAECNIEKDEITEFEVSMKNELTAQELIEEQQAEVIVNEVHVERDLAIDRASEEIAKINTEKVQDEFAELKIVKHQEIDAEYTELDSAEEIIEVKDMTIENEVNINESSKTLKMESYEMSEMNTEIQNEYTALNLAKQQILGIPEFGFESSFINQIEAESKIITESPERTPTPESPKALVDEYVFKLEIPLPKGITPVPPDPSPVEEKIIKIEDPDIVKRKLVPHIDLSIESAVFDPPLKSPEVRVCSPIYRKPGLRGGADRPEYRKDDIREIERKSSLLKSAIDQTIKSIEEYKEEVGMGNKKEVTIEKTSKTESSISSKIVQEVSNGVENLNNITDIEKSSNYPVEVRTNGFEIDEKFDANNSIVKDEKLNLNGNLLAPINDVENHVEDIKKIVKNTENISNITEINKMKAKMETIETKTMDNKELKMENVDIESNKLKAEIEPENKIVDKEILKVENEEVEDESKQLIKSNIADVVGSSQDTKPVTSTTESSVELKIDEQNVKVLEVNTTEEAKPIIAEDNKIVAEMNEADLEVKETLREDKIDPLLIVKPVEFHPENIRSSVSPRNVPVLEPPPPKEPYKTETGELIGTIQGIVDGLEEAVVDEEVAKELGKPGLPDEKIAELISGEAEMLREAHVMGLSRVISSHMHREDDSSVDFKKIKPLVGSLKDSEVLKALNEELLRTSEERKKEERRWTTFLQKPSRPVPKAKGGYPGNLQREVVDEEPYKVKIVKQPKPKIAPDYKPEDFDTGPLPWEERELIAAAEPPPNLTPEEPILVPEEAPEFLEAVDPLPESEVPDLEDTGIPLPPPPPEPTIPEIQEEVKLEEANQEVQAIRESEEVKEEPKEAMENNLVENLVRSVHNMVDPNAPLEQQLAQMRAQLTALAELPGVIAQTLELVTRQLFQLSHQQISQEFNQEQVQKEHVDQNLSVPQNEEVNQNTSGEVVNEVVNIEETQPQEVKHELSQEEIERMKREEEEIIEEQRRMEKQKKEQARLDQESRQLKQRPTPRVGKPKPVFGPLNPDRPVVLPGGRRWRTAQDAYNEELIRETLTAQAELIQGKALGVNFMKYEKPPVSLDHLKNSEVYKLIHDMDETPLRRVELLTPVIAEADYRERCRSRTPNIIKPHNAAQQLMP